MGKWAEEPSLDDAEFELRAQVPSPFQLFSRNGPLLSLLFLLPKRHFTNSHSFWSKTGNQGDCSRLGQGGIQNGDLQRIVYLKRE